MVKLSVKFLNLFLLLLLGLSLFACNRQQAPSRALESIRVDTETLLEVYDIDDFDLSSVLLVLVYNDGTQEKIPITETMIGQPDLELLTTLGTHEITISYRNFETTLSITMSYTGIRVQLRQIYNQGVEAGLIYETYEEWLESIKGEDGSQVVLEVRDGYIKWRYTHESTWRNLISLMELIGIAGTDGIGITAIDINHDFELIITLSNDEVINLGNIKGDAGNEGVSAYEIYRISFPDYEGDEVQWLDDLINGLLGDKEQITITLYVMGGEMPEGYEESIIIDKHATLALPTPTKEGYEFMGWFTGTSSSDGHFTNLTRVTSDLTLYARWDITIFTIIFLDITGGILKNAQGTVDMAIVPPEAPYFMGHTYIGWSEPYSYPTKNIITQTVYSINQYNISYVTYKNYDPKINIPLFEDEEIASITLGNNHASALTSAGRVFTWGANSSGQLGDGTINDRHTPTDITDQFNLNDGERIVSITLGNSHSSALTSEGRVFTWGDNGQGRLGDGTTEHRYTPTDITAQFNLTDEESVVSIALGFAHSSTLTTAGRVFTWGGNSYGQLGDGTTEIRHTPIDITDQIILSNKEVIVSIALGGDHSSALTSEGHMFTWGRNSNGQLGDGTSTHRHLPTNITAQFNLSNGEQILSIALGPSHSSVLTSDGRMFTWGYNWDGQLGNGTTTLSLTPIDITAYFDLNDKESIVSIILGNSHSAALTSEGRMFTWGANWSGQLGDGTTEHRYTPTDITMQFSLNDGEIIESIALGGNFSSMLTSGKVLFSWGLNTVGQLGQGIDSRYIPNDITVQFDLHDEEIIISIALGNSHSAALTSEGRMFTWGNNAQGRLGDGTTENRHTPIDITPYFNLGDGERIVAMSLGDSHSSALTSKGCVFMWGYNDSGRLGNGTTTTSHTPRDITGQFNLNEGEMIVSISLGNSHSAALTSEGRVFTWGGNWVGQLGDGTTTKSYVPIDITSHFNLNNGESIALLESGDYHLSALTSEGRMFTWGSNMYGRLGDGTTSNRLTPIDITSHFNLNDGEIIVLVSLGNTHSSALTSEDRMFTWGFNMYGKLGDGTTTDRHIPRDITPKFNLNDGESIVSISLEASHSSAITSENRIFIWGSNDYGKLGDGTTIDRYIPTDITSQFSVKEGESIVSTAFGDSNSSALTSEGHMFTWGSNNHGRLGIGTFDNGYLSQPKPLHFANLFSIVVHTYDYDNLLDAYTPSLIGYTFSGWFVDVEMTTPFTLTTMPAENITLYAAWTQSTP